MRTLLITAAMIAAIPAGAIAQDSTSVTTTVTTPAPAAVPPRAPGRNMPPDANAPDVNANVFVPDSPAASAAVPGTGGDGAIHQWGSAQPVVQAVPAPAASYPPCTHGRTDSCTNPNPARELPYYPGDRAG